MASTRRRTSESGPPTDGGRTPREKDIVDVARGTLSALPELYAAGRMFFRFDPGFRAELEAARVSWRREPTPISIDALSDKARFKLRVRLGNDRTLLEVARRLAARWGLHPEAMARTVAYDAPVNYPTVVVRSWETDPISGLRCLELRVFSEHAWAPLRRAIEAEEWLQDLQDLAWFRDTPARPYSRLRGMDAKVAARTLAIYFLTSPAPGARPTGGNRSWDDAVSLWNELPDEKPTGPLSRLK